MKVYIYNGRKGERCFADLQKACDYAIEDTVGYFKNIEFSGNARWLEENGLRKYKLYFNTIGKDYGNICAYVREYEVII